MKNKTIGMIGIKFALFSKDSDDLSITISMKKIIRNWGQNVAQGAIWRKIMRLHSRTENDH